MMCVGSQIIKMFHCSSLYIINLDIVVLISEEKHGEFTLEVN